MDAAADRLAVGTLQSWRQQLIQLGIQTPAPVRVRWRWAPEAVALPLQQLAYSPSLATDPNPIPSDTEERTAGQVRRLVLLRGPGAGKTGAMILLLIEALRHRERVPDATRARIPVPVWLTLGSWDPSLQGIRDWVTATISRDHPYLGQGISDQMRSLNCSIVAGSHSFWTAWMRCRKGCVVRPLNGCGRRRWTADGAHKSTGRI